MRPGKCALPPYWRALVQLRTSSFWVIHRQLEQPTQGSHPEGSDVSALGHVLGPSKTITPEQGIFLAKTRRLHPEVCKFTSEMFYEDRLSSHPGLENQRINAGGLLSGAGLWFALIEHSGNQSHSLEEINTVEEDCEILDETRSDMDES